MSRRYLLAAGCGCAMLLLLAAVAVPSQTPEQGADVSAPIPDAARARRNPQPASPESISNGKMVFSSQCTMCHGTKGDGQGDLVSRLKLTIPDFTDPGHQGSRTDGELFYILTHGHGRMRGEGDRLSDEIKWNLVNYIRSLSRTGG